MGREMSRDVVARFEFLGCGVPRRGAPPGRAQTAVAASSRGDVGDGAAPASSLVWADRMAGSADSNQSWLLKSADDPTGLQIGTARGRYFVTRQVTKCRSAAITCPTCFVT